MGITWGLVLGLYTATHQRLGEDRRQALPGDFSPVSYRWRLQPSGPCPLPAPADNCFFLSRTSGSTRASSPLLSPIFQRHPGLLSAHSMPLWELRKGSHSRQAYDLAGEPQGPVTLPWPGILVQCTSCTTVYGIPAGSTQEHLRKVPRDLQTRVCKETANCNH